MKDNKQGLLDFDTGNNKGFENWHQEQEERIAKIRKEWSVPIGKTVRVKLKNIDYEFEGKLKLAKQPTKIDKKIPLHLKIDRIDFFPADIERLMVIN